MTRLLLALLVLAPATASAAGISARFSNQVATVGAPLDVEVLVEDPVDAVHRIQIELRRPDSATWTATTARDAGDTGDLRRWTARFDAASLWPPTEEAPRTLELRAMLYGRRGGLLMILGEISPFEMDVLTPDRAAARDRALRRPSTTPTEVTGADSIALAGYVAAEGRLGSAARARAFIGAGGAIGDTLELLGGVVVGPSFSEPADLSGGGPFSLGFELALRAYVDPLEVATWTLFAQPYLTGDARLPGFDAGGGLRAGVLYWVSKEVAVEASLGGAMMLFGLALPDGEERNLGFSGGLRAGIRFGPERQ